MLWSCTWKWRYSATHFNLGTWWMWVVSFRPSSLYPLREIFRISWNMALGGPHSRSGRFRQEKISYPDRLSKRHFLFNSVRNLVTILTELHGFKFCSDVAECWGRTPTSCFAFGGSGVPIPVPRQTILPSSFVYFSVYPGKFREHEQDTGMGENSFLCRPSQFTADKV
jgi:hypothetical protein